MSNKEKPLPRPPRRPFGPGGRTGKRPEEPEKGQEGLLLADEIQGAVAGGSLEEFLKEKFGGNEQAMKMAQLMLGLSGMMPPGIPGVTISSTAGGEHGASETDKSTESTAPTGKAAPEVIEAASRGDVEALKGLLRKEQEKRSGPAKPGVRKKGRHKPPEAGERPGRLMEKAVLEQLGRIASENSVSLDWVVARALALYVRDYLSTGRL